MWKVRLRSEQDYGPCGQARNAIPIFTNIFTILLRQFLSDRLLLVDTGKLKSNFSNEFKLTPIITYHVKFVVKSSGNTSQDYGPCCQARNAMPISTIFLQQLLSDKLLLIVTGK